MRQRVIRGLTKVRVPCAEALGGLKLELDKGLDAGKAGWQLLFRGYGKAVIFNALPLTFLIQGKLVAQVIAIRAEGDDWWGMFVPEPAPKSVEEADARFGAEAKVGDVMRQITEAMKAGAPSFASAPGEAPAPAMAKPVNRHERRRHEALVRRKPGVAAAKVPEARR